MLLQIYRIKISGPVEASGWQAQWVGGSKFDDKLTDDSGNNTLAGQGGADVLDGGAGFDYAGYFNAKEGLTVSLDPLFGNNGEASGDIFTSIEGLIGSEFDDVLIGNSEGNWLEGRGGKDALDGGGGLDTASYFNATIGVTASLAQPSNNTGEAAGDTYTSIERLGGSAFDDTLIGDAGNNILVGHGGADVLIGGGGSDFAGYYNATTGVTVSLANPNINTGEAAGDSFIGIRGLVGSGFDDVLIGDANSNGFTGGAGKDMFVFANTVNNVDTISDFVAGFDRIALDHSIFTTAGGAGSLADEAFHTGIGAHDETDRIIYNSLNGHLMYDPDGNVASNSNISLFAVLPIGLNLTAADFLIL